MDYVTVRDAYAAYCDLFGCYSPIWDLDEFRRRCWMVATGHVTPAHIAQAYHRSLHDVDAMWRVPSLSECAAERD